MVYTLLMLRALTFLNFSGYCPKSTDILLYRFYTSNDDLVVFEVLDEAAAAVSVKFREDVVEEDDGVFTESLSNEGCFNKFKSKDDRAGFATRGGSISDLMIKTKDIVIAVNTKTSVSEVDIALSGLF